MLEAITNANDLLDYMQALQSNLRETCPNATEPGVYWTNGQVYKIVISRTSGQPYAKRDANGTWEYAPGVIYSLKTCDLLTYEQAAAIGRATGNCVCCGRELSDQDSVAAGIGPVCAKRWYGITPKKVAKAKAAKAA
jgi:hypothetical protein